MLFGDPLAKALMWTHVLFLLFVALAVYAQALTGFALALILLGLVGATDLMPLNDAINAVMIMILATTCTFLYRRWPIQFERSLWPAVASGVLGALAGIVLLNWLAVAAYNYLRLLLGLSIIVCAVLLWRSAKPLKAVSSRRSFVLAGAISGLLGGLFSASGPPMVYLMYRQPLAIERIQESLILFFGLGAALRLAVILPTGHFSAHATVLAAEAVPVVFLVASFAARRALPVPLAVLKGIVCLMLIAAGLSMVLAVLNEM